MKTSRVVVITGASAGVGRATVREFARTGAKLGLLARNAEALANAKREVEDLGSRAVAIPTDVADAQAVELAAARVEAELGPIEIWVNVAMVSVFSPVRLMLAEEYRRVTEVTYLGYVFGTQSALKRMLPRNRGVIIQVGSALAYRSIPLQSAYCAAKHAILGFTESLRTELLHDRSRVRVTMLELPAVNTPQFGWVKSRLPNCPQPVPPIYQPEVIARAIEWSSRHKRRELYVGFPAVKAIVAERLSPHVGDLYLARTGYKSQQTSQPDSHHRPDNLWHTVPGDHGAHGAFDSRARAFSIQLWLNLNRRTLLFTTTAAALLMMGARKLIRGWTAGYSSSARS
ncbi:MAG: SDR family oxidoreductase [Deltaproteobacteria bacterium]|nr:SDR family oxidoreductase [Deltaproteobacteria bacterium]